MVAKCQLAGLVQQLVGHFNIVPSIDRLLAITAGAVHGCHGDD